MDSQIIAFLVIVAGAIFAIVVPYILKAREEGIPFNLSYIYGMIISLVIAAFAVLPDSVEMAFKPLFALFLAGAGLQVVANKVITTRLKAKEE